MSLEPEKREKRKLWSADSIQKPIRGAAKKEKFDFQKMKIAATSDDPAVRKAEFIRYFERFGEFPSFLFDNEQSLDPRLAATMSDLSVDTDSSKTLLDGVSALLGRLPSVAEDDIPNRPSGT